jgi:hypothetical protein
MNGMRKEAARGGVFVEFDWPNNVQALLRIGSGKTGGRPPLDRPTPSREGDVV